MTKSNEGLCRLCRSLALPVCDCGELATAHVEGALILYSNDLSLVSLTTAWTSPEGKLKWLEETDLLCKARVSAVHDIQLTKD